MWDGHLLHEGISPLQSLPSTLVNLPSLSDAYLSGLYPLLNSPDYFTVYPPVSQVIFFLSTLSDSWSYELSSIVMKTILMVCDVITCFILFKLLPLVKLDKRWSLVYFLNPLLVIETCGQLHYEGIMVMFLAGSLLFAYSKRSVSYTHLTLPTICSV